MIKITDGKVIKTVTHGAHKSYFSNWKPFVEGMKIGSEAPTIIEPVDLPPIEPVVVDEVEEDEPIVEKPLSEMSLDELRAFATENGYDMSGVANRKRDYETAIAKKIVG